LGWRNNNLPDWDFWRIEKQQRNPKFKLSWGGLLWRYISTAKFYTVFDNTGGKGRLSRLPVLSWYMYWLIHKPSKKRLSPLNNRSRKNSINNYFERNTLNGTLNDRDIITSMFFVAIFF
jgi:hypothetical protein